MSDEQLNAYRESLAVVMGDVSERSQQNAQHIKWAYDSLLSAVAEAVGELTEEAVREIVPAQTLRLAINVDWIPHLADNGDPYTDSVGDLDVHGHCVTQAFYDAFLRLLPIDNYIEFIKQPWATSPKLIIAEVQQELGWGDPEFIEAMQVINGTQWTMRGGKKDLIDWRDSKERYGLKRLRQEPDLNSRFRRAQTDHRRTAWLVVVKHSRKYATLPFEAFNWRKA